VPHLGPPALLGSESAADYDALSAAIFGKLKPTDIFEEMWTQDIVDLIWEHRRWRRYRENYIDSRFPAELLQTLELLRDSEEYQSKSWKGQLDGDFARTNNEVGKELVRQWIAGDVDAAKHIEQLLASLKLSMDSVWARTAAKALDEIESFTRLIANAEWRRDALLREIDRRRASFAEKARGELKTLEGTVDSKISDGSSQKQVTKQVTKRAA
jgi:hypothetical protein